MSAVPLFDWTFHSLMSYSLALCPSSLPSSQSITQISFPLLVFCSIKRCAS